MMTVSVLYIIVLHLIYVLLRYSTHHHFICDEKEA